MTKTVDSPGVKMASDIPGNWQETVQAIIDLGGQAVGLNQIAEQREVTKQAVSKHFPEIVEEGIITKEGKEKPFIYKLTGKGYRSIDNPPYGTGSVDNPDSIESGKSVRRLHGLTVVAEVAGSDVVPREWMGRMKEHERVNFSKMNNGNEFLVWTNRFFLRLHKDSATIQLREGCDYSTSSDIEAFLEFHEELQELLQWVERASGVSMKKDLVDLRRCELAFEDHHLAQLVHAVPGLELSDFVVQDEDIGEEVIGLDDSFGPELETMSGEQAEAVGHVVDAELRQYARNPGSVRRRHRFENELSAQGVGGQEAVHTIREVSGVREEVEQLRDEVGSVTESVSELAENMESMTVSVEQGLQKVVTAVEEGNSGKVQSGETTGMAIGNESEVSSVEKRLKQIQESLESGIAISSSRSQADEQIIELLESIRSEIESQVQEEDVVDQVFERAMERDGWSRPFLYPDGSLRVWDNSGEKSVPRKLLDENIVESSDSHYLELLQK